MLFDLRPLSRESNPHDPNPHERFHENFPNAAVT
jgi:hypothetical protein